MLRNNGVSRGWASMLCGRERDHYFFPLPLHQLGTGCAVTRKDHYTTKTANPLGQLSLKMVGEERSLRLCVPSTVIHCLFVFWNDWIDTTTESWSSLRCDFILSNSACAPLISTRLCSILPTIHPRRSTRIDQPHLFQRPLHQPHLVHVSEATSHRYISKEASMQNWKPSFRKLYYVRVTFGKDGFGGFDSSLTPRDTRTRFIRWRSDGAGVQHWETIPGGGLSSFKRTTWTWFRATIWYGAVFTFYLKTNSTRYKCTIIFTTSTVKPFQKHPSTRTLLLWVAWTLSLFHHLTP